MSTAAKTATRTPLPGAVVDGYTVERELPGHHAGELRFAVFGRYGSPATLTASSRRDIDRAESARLRRLAERRAQLDHPAAIRVRSIAESGGRPVLITDPFPARTFADVLENEAPLSPERVVAMLAPVAEALDLAHAHGLIHKHLTGHSLLLAGRNRLLLDTFGLLVDEDAPARTVAEARALRYRPPEQAAGEPLGRTANVYSLAALLVHALTGAAPYQSERRAVVYSTEAELPSRTGEAARRIAHAVTRSPRFNAGAHAMMHLRHTPVPVRVSERMPHLYGTAIDAVLARGMAESPANRHASATALLKDVADALGVEWPDSSASVSARPRLHLVTDRMHPVPHAPAPATARRRRWLAAAALAIALACGALGAVALTPFGHHEPAPVRAAATPAAWTALDDQRAALREELAVARTPNEQAGPAARLAGLYSAASRAAGPASLRAATREAGSAYARLAAAAQNGDEAGYADAASAIETAEARVALAASRR
jgi:Protein kinase domain